ncbi:hypothetical protein TWF281_004766 [Arthrobotrys megalospora]
MVCGQAGADNPFFCNNTVSSFFKSGGCQHRRLQRRFYYSTVQLHSKSPSPTRKPLLPSLTPTPPQLLSSRTNTTPHLQPQSPSESKQNPRIPMMRRSAPSGGRDEMERLQQILGTSIMAQRYTFFRQQQVCTQPTARTYSFDDADDKGVLHIAIDAAQRAKDVMDSCNSCETLGDQMAKIVHGQCVELFRIRCDEGEDGERRIEGLELDLRQIKKKEVGQILSESQSARMKLLEARMRGTDSTKLLTGERDDIWDQPDEKEELGSVRLLKGIKNIADKYQDQSGEKRRRLGPDEEVVIKPDSKEEGKEKPKDSEKKDAKSRATSLVTKPVSLIQPRSRNSKQSPAVQMIPQPKEEQKSKTKKKKKKQQENDTIEITRIISPIQTVTIYDAPSEGDLSLRNPQIAWAQRRGDELTITQRGEQRPSDLQNYSSGHTGNEPPPGFYSSRVDAEREKYRNVYKFQQPHERPRTNVFILYSTEDEKASPNHRTDIFSPPRNGNVGPGRMVGSIKPIDSDDGLENQKGSASNGHGIFDIQKRGPRHEQKILLNQPNVTLSHEEIDNDVAAAMEALKLEDKNNGNLNLEATFDVLRRNQERVSAEINNLLKLKEKTLEEDREIDRLLELNNIPPVKYKVTQPGQQFSLSQTLDDLIDLGAQNAPSFEPKSPVPESRDHIASTALYMPSDGCRQPTQQEKQEWLDSFTASTTPTLSTGGSESDAGEKLDQTDTSPLRDDHAATPDVIEGADGLTMFPLNAMARPVAEGLETSPELRIPTPRYPPGFGQKTDANALPDAFDTPLKHPGPTITSTPVKPLLERLGDEFEKLDTSIARRSGKKQKIKSRVVKKEWPSHFDESFDTHPESREITIDGVQRTMKEILDGDSSISGLSTPDETQQESILIPDLDIEQRGFKVPTAEFTVESPMQIDPEAPKIKAPPTTPLRLKLSPDTPLKSILKKNSQFPKLTGAKAAIIEPLRRERRVGEQPHTPKRFSSGVQNPYADIPFPDTPLKIQDGVLEAEDIDLPTRKPEPKPESPPLPETMPYEQRYKIALSNLSKLPGFVNEGDPPLVGPESEEEIEETEEERLVKRLMKGKAPDRDNWSGLDYRHFEYPPRQITPPQPRSPPFLRRARMGQDDIILVRALHESLCQAEQEFVIEKNKESSIEEIVPDTVRDETEDIAEATGNTEKASSTVDVMEEISPPTDGLDSKEVPTVLTPVLTGNQTASEKILPLDLTQDEEVYDPFTPAKERARKEAEKAEL